MTKSMSSFVITNLIAVSFIGGIIFGKYATPPRVETKIIERIIRVQQAAKVETKVITVQEKKSQIKIHRVYARSGKLKSETMTKNQSQDVQTQNTNMESVQTILSEHSLLAASITESPRNWLLGLAVKPLDYTNYTSYSLQLSYRVVGPLFVSAQSDVIFTRPMVGFMIEF